MKSAGQEQSSPTFSLFSNLPPELRLRIWGCAVEDATINRMLRVAVYNLLGVTFHSCFTMEGVFCGRHGSCSRYIYGVTTEPNFTSDCLIDGYFSVTNQFPSPETPGSLERIAAACRESRHLVVSHYPETLKIYRGQWHPHIESRLVRCCPAKDVLLVTAVPDLRIAHVCQEDTVDEYHEFSTASRKRVFPRDAALFTRFRDIVSSFQHIAFYYTGSRTFDSGTDDESEWPLPSITAKVKDLLNSTDLMALLAFFASLKHLYLWPDPKHWPELKVNPVAVDDISYLIEGGQLIEDIREDAECFMSEYNESVRVQVSHYVDTEEHWVVRPKELPKIGCYAPRSWV